MHKKQLFLCTKNSFSSHINTNKKLHLAALMSVVFLCVYTFLFLNPLPAYMDNTKATPAITSSELNVTTSDISIDTSVDSPSGTFRESSPANISVATDNYSGYTLSIDSSLDNEYANKLVNSNETAVINSISSVSTESDFTSNTWGIKPSKLEGDDNTNFIPAPSYDNTVTIDTTSGSSIEPTVYTMSIATKVDYSLPADTYSNTYVVIAVGNPTLYTIEYDKNVDGDVSNMPATQASDTEDASITLSSTTPTSAKKYKFLSWCDGTVTDNDGIPSCDGTVYDPGDEYDLDQTTDNYVVLYGMWDRTATLLMGFEFNDRIRKLAPSSSAANIVAIKQANALPEGVTLSSYSNVISTSGSPIVYAWYDNTDDAKTVYFYTDAGRIKANQNSKKMFESMTSLLDISGLASFDTSDVKDMSYMFSGAYSLTNLDALSNWDTSSVTNADHMFNSARSLTNIDGLSNWDTSSITNMSYMFAHTRSLTDIDALDAVQHEGKSYVSWNTSSVTDMSYMFYGASSLIDVNGASNWDTSNVTTMSSMFRPYLEYKVPLADISGLSNWNTSNVTDMSYMFQNTRITNINALATGQREGKNYVSWDVSNVTKMNYMFSEDAALTNIDGASNWDTSSVLYMNNMFAVDTSLVSIDGASNWNTSSVVNMASMFPRVNVSNIDALATGQREGKNYVSWDVSSVANMGSMFGGMTSLTDIKGASDWDTSSVEDMSSMFYNTRMSDVYDLENWDVSNVTNMSGLFSSAANLNDINGLANWDTSSVNNMSTMFNGTKITNIDALATGQREGKDYVSWDVSNVVDMNGMFVNARSLVDVDGATNWDTSNVTNMRGIFLYNSSLQDIKGVTNWNTSSVTDMGAMFLGTKITNIDALATGQREGKNYVSWDVSNVTNMRSMFTETYLTNIDGAIDWNTSKVESMGAMFSGAGLLQNVNGAINWDTSNVTNMISHHSNSSRNGMFYNCTSLEDISGLTYWNTSKVTSFKNMFYGTKITNIDAIATGQREGKDYISWDTSSVTDMNSMFYLATSLADVNGATNWNVSNVTDMGNMFYKCTSLTDPDDLDPLNNWTINASLNKTNMFSNVPDTVLRPNWY